MRPQDLPPKRVITQSELAELRARHPDRTIVLATGCFDLMHTGHLYFLEQAARHGDVLVVGVNDDESVRGLKGPTRPIFPEADRCAMLAAFRVVDFVFTYPESCAGVSIGELRPNVFVVGSESIGGYPDEMHAARDVNARIEPIAKTPAPSTTEVILGIRAGRTLPSVSVVYVNWNTRALLADSLASLYRHANERPMQVVVVDNGSTDGTVAWLEQEHPQVEVVALPKNIGFGLGNNHGFERATGDYLLCLNTDTIVQPTTVSGLAAFLDQRADVGCVGARHLNEDRSLQRSMDSFPNLEADFITLTELHRLPVVARYLARRHAWWGSHDEPRLVDWVNGACLMVRRQVLDDVGGFDQRFFIYGEEQDWCLRMRRVGWHVAFVPDAEVVHLGGGAMDRIPIERLALQHMGLLRLYDLHRGLAARLAIRAIVLATLAARSLLLCVGTPLLLPTGRAHRFRAIVSQLGPQTGVGTALGAFVQVALATLRSYR